MKENILIDNNNSKKLRITKICFICGIVSSLIYLGVDITVSVYWNEFYDYTSQGFSELLAFESPTRSFVLSFSILYNVLVIAFGLGAFITAGKKLSQRITGILLVGSSQTLEVDVISGATVTSKAHLKALENALEQAQPEK